MHTIYRRFSLFVFLVGLTLPSLFFAASALAEGTQMLTPQQAAILKPLVEAANRATVHGPAVIPLLDQATLDLPKGYGFLPQKEAAALLNATGHVTRDSFVGIITPDHASTDGAVANNENWMMTLDFNKSGYVKDDDAKSWNTDELLQNIIEATKAGNANRIEKGFPSIEVKGWVERPAYDASTHRLVYSVLAEVIGDLLPPSINYNTYALGREGYIRINLVTHNIAQDKPRIQEILASIHYNDGKRYEDFSASSDKVAEFGLAALVMGIAAKKLGLLAMAGIFFVKIWKLLAIAAVVLVSRFKKIFGKKEKTGDELK